MRPESKQKQPDQRTISARSRSQQERCEEQSNLHTSALRPSCDPRVFRRRDTARVATTHAHDAGYLSRLRSATVTQSQQRNSEVRNTHTHTPHSSRGKAFTQCATHRSDSVMTCENGHHTRGSKCGWKGEGVTETCSSGPVGYVEHHTDSPSNVFAKNSSGISLIAPFKMRPCAAVRRVARASVISSAAERSGSARTVLSTRSIESRVSQS